MDSKVWLITGAGRGMGVDFTKAALATGHKVVATGRNTDSVAKAIGVAENLLVVKLDVASAAEAEAAVNAAVKKFGHIDVLVNNAANFYAGFFEELTMEQIEEQLQTSLIGPMIVTVLFCQLCANNVRGTSFQSLQPRFTSFDFCSAYSASSLDEGWMQALHVEVAPFGIHTPLSTPVFPHELLTAVNELC
jgi:NAD(P)-dependent dehydrogenase (short-subunit alcohol dehydrogenase family)